MTPATSLSPLPARSAALIAAELHDMLIEAAKSAAEDGTLHEGSDILQKFPVGSRMLMDAFRAGMVHLAIERLRDRDVERYVETHGESGLPPLVPAHYEADFIRGFNDASRDEYTATADASPVPRSWYEAGFQCFWMFDDTLWWMVAYPTLETRARP